MILKASCLAKSKSAGRLRREYLNKDEVAEKRPHHLAMGSTDKDELTFDGHWLFSLYRVSSIQDQR